MKLFSETNSFQSLRFTLIGGSWQEINAHFFMNLFAEKTLLQMMCTFVLPANAQFGDRGVHKKVQVIFLYGLTQAWL